MAKKADLLAEAKKLKLEVTEKNTIAEIEAAIEAAAATEVVEEAPAKEAPVAKAGKRSTKAIKEAEEKAAKEERKAHADEVEHVSTKKPIIIKSKLERKGKKYRKAAEAIDKTKTYSLKQATDLTVAASTTKFDATVELHIRLGVDPRHADQNIRANLVLPEGSGKKVRVAVFAEADDVVKAKAAGADVAGTEEFLQQLDKGVLDFDVLVATPAVMPKLGKYARILGPKGLMPSPKSGTVTPDVTKAIKEAKAGKVEYRVDSNGIVHLGVGKVSFGADKIVNNAKAVLSSIKAVKPASTKGNYVLSIYMTSSMGPSVKIESSEV